MLNGKRTFRRFCSLFYGGTNQVTLQNVDVRICFFSFMRFFCNYRKIVLFAIVISKLLVTFGKFAKIVHRQKFATLIKNDGSRCTNVGDFAPGHPPRSFLYPLPYTDIDHIRTTCCRKSSISSVNNYSILRYRCGFKEHSSRFGSTLGPHFIISLF